MQDVWFPAGKVPAREAPGGEAPGQLEAGGEPLPAPEPPPVSAHPFLIHLERCLARERARREELAQSARDVRGVRWTLS